MPRCTSHAKPHAAPAAPTGEPGTEVPGCPPRVPPKALGIRTRGLPPTARLIHYSASPRQCAASRVRKCPGARHTCRRKPTAFAPVGCRPRLASLITQPPLANVKRRRRVGGEGAKQPEIPTQRRSKNTALCSGWKARATCFPLQSSPNSCSIRVHSWFKSPLCVSLRVFAASRESPQLQASQRSSTDLGLESPSYMLSSPIRPPIRVPFVSIRGSKPPPFVSIRGSKRPSAFPFAPSRLRVSPKPSPPKRPHHHRIQTRQNRDSAASGKSR